MLAILRAALLVAAAHGPGRSGLLARSFGRAEASRAWVQVMPDFGRSSSPGAVLGKHWIRLLLILDNNYDLTTNNFTTETQSSQRTHTDFLAKRSVAGCKLRSLQAAGSSTGQPHRPFGSAALVAAAFGPGPSGQRRSRHGTLGFSCGWNFGKGCPAV